MESPTKNPDGPFFCTVQMKRYLMLTKRVETVSKRVKSIIRIGAFICVGLVAVGLGPRFAGLSPSGNAYALPDALLANPPTGPSECGSQYEAFTPAFSRPPCTRKAVTCGFVAGLKGCWVCDEVSPEKPMKEAPNSPNANYYKKTEIPCLGRYTGECVKSAETGSVKDFQCLDVKSPNPQRSTCGVYEVTRPAAKCTDTLGGG